MLSRVQRLIALTLTAIAYWLACFAPYEWIAPASYALNDAQLIPAKNGQPQTLKLGGMGMAEFVDVLPPAWQVTPETLRLQLQLRCAVEEQFGPARIFSLSTDTLNRNLTLGQDGVALVLRLLRPASNRNGLPEYRVEGFFAGCKTRELDLSISTGALRLVADDQLLLDIAAPAASLERWLVSHPLLVGNEASWNRGWRGELKALRFTIDGDVIVPGLESLLLPEGAWLLSERARDTHRFTLIPFRRDGPVLWVDNLANVLGFLPFGLLLALGWGMRLNWVYAGLLAALLSSSIELGQIGFAGRHPSATDIVTNTTGGVIGFFLGMAWLQRRQRAKSR